MLDDVQGTVTDVGDKLPGWLEALMGIGPVGMVAVGIVLAAGLVKFVIVPIMQARKHDSR